MNEPFEWEKSDDPYATPHRIEDAEVPAKGGSCLWIGFIWGTPTVAVPLILGLFGSVWPVGVALALGLLFLMGRMQSADFAAEPGAATHRQWGRVILYMVIQMVLIPMLWFAVVWGFCAISGSGKFK